MELIVKRRVRAGRCASILDYDGAECIAEQAGRAQQSRFKTVQVRN